jgi:hypothetical protein
MSASLLPYVLIYSCSNNKTFLIKTLIDNGATDLVGGFLAACRNGHKIAAKLIIELCSDVASVFGTLLN